MRLMRISLVQGMLHVSPIDDRSPSGLTDRGRGRVSVAPHSRRWCAAWEVGSPVQPMNDKHDIAANMEFSQIRNYREIGQKSPDFGC